MPAIVSGAASRTAPSSDARPGSDGATPFLPAHLQFHFLGHPVLLTKSPMTARAIKVAITIKTTFKTSHIGEPVPRDKATFPKARTQSSRQNYNLGKSFALEQCSKAPTSGSVTLRNCEELSWWVEGAAAGKGNGQKPLWANVSPAPDRPRSGVGFQPVAGVCLRRWSYRTSRSTSVGCGVFTLANRAGAS